MPLCGAARRLTTRSAIDTAVGLVAESERSVRVCQRRSRCAGGGAMKHMTRKATRHVNQNEGLIFEKSSPGKAAWKLPPLDVPEVDTAKLLGSVRKKRSGQHARSERDRNHPPLHAAFHLELRHRSRHVSAGLLHHEVQPAGERSGGAAGGHGQRASLPAGEDFAGRVAHPQDAERVPDRNHRHGRDHAAARRRRARRDDRAADGARLSPVEGQSRARRF